MGKLGTSLAVVFLVVVAGCQEASNLQGLSNFVDSTGSSLSIGFAQGDSASAVTGNLTLPTKVGTDSTVTWASSQPSVISTDGTVTQPASDQPDVTVDLTATVTSSSNRSSGSTATTFVLTVKAKTAAEEVAAAKTALAVGYASGDSASSVTQNLTLPSTAGNSVSVTWASSKTAVLLATGVVTRPPAGSSNVQVTLTATLTKSTAKATKTFTLTIIALPVVSTPAQDIATVKAALAIGYATGDTSSAVTQNLTLSTAGANSVAISWSSSSPSVVSSAGVVTRPASGSSDAAVVLTATLTKSGSSDTKTFSITVKALAVVTYTVTFSSGGGSAVSPVVVNSGALLVRPSDPVLAGSTFAGWYKESGLVNAWDFAVDKVTSALTLYAKWTANSGVGTALKLGYTRWGSDRAVITSAPTNGILFSSWVKIIEPTANANGDWTAYPYLKDGVTSYWNTENLDINGSNWSVRFITGNASWNNTTKVGWYNANSMLMAKGLYVNDYSNYATNPAGIDSATLTGWIWVAWQSVVDTSSQTITLRQWLKYGTSGAVFAAGSDQVPFSTVRSSLLSGGVAAAEANAWVPSALTNLEIGIDYGYMTKVRIEDRTTTPTLAELEAFSTQTAPDAAAWAWYPFEWRSGAPYLKDESGNGRDLTVKTGGTLRAGVTNPY